MKASYISTDQWKSIFKSAAYAFASGFTGTLALMALDFVKAAQDGKTAILNLSLALLAGAVIGGVNGVFVFIKKLFTDPV